MNEKLTNNYKIIDLNQKNNGKKINRNNLRINDKYEEYVKQLQSSVDEISYINVDKNRTRQFNKAILINHAKDKKLNEKLNMKIHKLPFNSYMNKANELNKTKNIHYKTIKERQKLIRVGHYNFQNKNIFNNNTFNKKMTRNVIGKTINLIKNNTNDDEKAFNPLSVKNANSCGINCFNLNNKSKLKDKSFLIINNNTNYNNFKSFLIIDNKRKCSSTLNNCINRANILKQRNNNNLNDIQSYRKIY